MTSSSDGSSSLIPSLSLKHEGIVLLPTEKAGSSFELLSLIFLAAFIDGAVFDSRSLAFKALYSAIFSRKIEALLVSVELLSVSFPSPFK